MQIIIEILSIIGALGILLGILLLLWARKKFIVAMRIQSEASQQFKSIKKEIETERREATIKIKDELHRRRQDFELEIKRDRLELDRLQSKIAMRSENLDKKEQRLDELAQELQQKERKISRTSDMLRVNEQKLKNLYDELIVKLESIGGISRDDARKELFNTLEAEVKLVNEKWIQKVEDEARQIAKQKSIDIVIGSMQRYVAEQVSSHTIGVVQLPNEEMKGRIIGKEGRNIKALELATGMEFIIGETPESITISGFNPIRREIAKRSLEKLVQDGRINPTRIEETVTQCEKEIDEIIEEYGKEAIFQFNLQGVHPEIVTLLGKLHFRTSFSQNVLMHSKEVGLFARMIAEELGLDGSIALRGGLLHDIGKAVSAEVEGPHALIGRDIAKRCGEDPIIVNAIAAHHDEVPPTSVYSLIVQIADTISAARPGARRETLTAYLKRLEKLEEIANTFEGVKKAYALQAGREVRIIVQEDYLDDEKAAMLARDIARKIEKEMTFPGQIKVNVIREKRSIEYAR